MFEVANFEVLFIFSSKVTHIYWNEQHLITCYPEDYENGWCATRRMGDLIDKEPGYNSGWGYCDFSDSCDGRINNTFDSRGIVVSSVFRKIIEYVSRQAFRYR